MKLIFRTCTGLNHETQNLVNEFHFESELAFSVNNTMCRRWVEGSSRKGKKALHRTIFLSFCSTMDFLSLMLVRSTACKTGGQRRQFDDLFCGLLYEHDPKQVMHYAFDVLAKQKVLSAQALDIIYAQLYCPPVFHPDADFEDEVAPMAACVLASRFRSDFVCRPHLKWKLHIHTLLHEGQFCSMYHMSYPSFYKILQLLSPKLQVDAKQSRCCTGGEDLIGPELSLHCTLRYLAGGSYHDIRTSAGLSKASFYNAVHGGLDALISCDALKLVYPSTLPELKAKANAFKARSSNGALDGCVGALDGWLCHIEVPSATETPNVTSYFSGHYQCYGLNVQATCDADCRFTYLSIHCPGGTGDSKAFFGCSLYDVVDSLPKGFYVVADNAYTLSDHVLIPYCGNDKKDPTKDSYNFFLSQLRIRIEQSFGMLVNKWHIFKKPLEMSLHNNTRIIEAAFRLHNFCIDEGDIKVDAVSNRDPEQHVPAYEEYLTAPSTDGRAHQNGWHVVREAIRQQLAADGRKRPRYNVERNKQLMP